MFSRIRQFIYEDTDKPIWHINVFIAVRQGSLFYGVPDSGARTTGWRAHVLAADINNGNCISYVQLFLAEDYAGQIYEVDLARDSAIKRRESFGHKYLYYPDGKQGKYSGDAKPMEAITAARTFPPSEPVIQTE